MIAGGYSSLLCAARNPKLVNGLVLLNAAGRYARYCCISSISVLLSYHNFKYNPNIFVEQCSSRNPSPWHEKMQCCLWYRVNAPVVLKMWL